TSSTSCTLEAPRDSATIAEISACAPRIADPIATTIARIRSIRLPVKRSNAVSAVPGEGICPQAACSAASAATHSSVWGDDAVFHGPPEQVDLRRRGTADLDVLHAHPRDVLLRGGVGHAEALGDGLQRKPGRVQPQHVALAHRQLRVGELPVALHCTGPLDVVE